MTTRERLIAACAEITRDAIGEFCAETGLTYLGPDGPLHVLGGIRVRGTFRSPDGRHWADAHLVAESMTVGTGLTAHMRDYWTDRAGDSIEGHGLWVATAERGLHDATISPLAAIAGQLELPAPERFPDGWARSWHDYPWQSDETELQLIAHGLPGTDGRRNQGQL
ncbi:hypothetical protein [Actinacidiphila oryziradicis]|uniref:Uncharacterized protein n=1 Tax=Actinacidiphila oryziradicis TaxID=2571141 RepID=A0A4U0ST14_9ACTN|nr:hypothetical protein [Actinacidiphila oryziradicis]TKA13202.1 hypothetical protein FCI23_00195 [Actinacidiphila oryziradicis]